jgi:hypothetical protein
MNERIEELALQARNYALDEKRIYERMHNTEQCMEEYREVYNKRFAELMVKKFDDILLLQQLDSIGNNDKKSAELIEQIRDKTKTYFGVEE